MAWHWIWARAKHRVGLERTHFCTRFRGQSNSRGRSSPNVEVLRVVVRRCNRVMSTVLQFGVRRAARGSQLHPALKEFLDAVVIPALVKAYLLESCSENRVAIVTSDVPHSPSKEPLSAEGVL
jgi:hypothetical protein